MALVVQELVRMTVIEITTHEMFDNFHAQTWHREMPEVRDNITFRLITGYEKGIRELFASGYGDMLLGKEAIIHSSESQLMLVSVISSHGQFQIKLLK